MDFENLMRMSKLIFFFVILNVGIVSAFDAHVSVPERYHVVHPGEELKFEITIKDVESVGRQDFSLEYFLILNGNVIARKKVVKAIETQASFLGNIKIPEDAPAGKYVLEVDVNGKKIYTTFEVKLGAGKTSYSGFLIFIGAAILLVALIILYEVKRLIKIDEELEVIETQLMN